jgi:hypothetical protein
MSNENTASSTGGVNWRRRQLSTITIIENGNKCIEQKLTLATSGVSGGEAGATRGWAPRRTLKEDGGVLAFAFRGFGARILGVGGGESGTNPAGRTESSIEASPAAESTAATDGYCGALADVAAAEMSALFTATLPLLERFCLCRDWLLCLRGLGLGLGVLS